MPCVPAYNEINERVGGKVYIVPPACNDIHGAIAFYSMSKFSTFEFCPTHCEYVRLYVNAPGRANEGTDLHYKSLVSLSM